MPKDKNQRLDNKVKEIDKIVHNNHNLTLGQRAADFVTKLGGSWIFIIFFFIFIFIWVGINVYLVIYRWDPYPFILLNLLLSLLAAVQAPIILMSQNRQTERDRLKAERDYIVNRKAEREIEDIQKNLKDIKNILKKR